MTNLTTTTTTAAMTYNATPTTQAVTTTPTMKKQATKSNNITDVIVCCLQSDMRVCNHGFFLSPSLSLHQLQLFSVWTVFINTSLFGSILTQLAGNPSPRFQQQKLVSLGQKKFNICVMKYSFKSELLTTQALNQIQDIKLVKGRIWTFVELLFYHRKKSQDKSVLSCYGVNEWNFLHNSQKAEDMAWMETVIILGFRQSVAVSGLHSLIPLFIIFHTFSKEDRFISSLNPFTFFSH